MTEQPIHKPTDRKGLNGEEQPVNGQERKLRRHVRVRSIAFAALASVACIAMGAGQYNNTRAQTPTANATKTLHSFAKDTSPASLVALGDSITFGYNLGPDNSAPSQYAFPYVVASDEGGWTVQDLGVPGWTSSDLLQALGTSKFQTALQNAKVVTLDIGNNDLLQAAAPLLTQAEKSGGKYTVTPEVIKNLAAAIIKIQMNLPLIVQKIRAQTSAPIVMVNLYNPFPDGLAIHDLTEQMLTLANSIVENTAAEAGATVADAYGTFNHQQATLVRIANIDVHPTIQGQKALANLVEADLAQPLMYQPTYYAVSQKGTVVRTQPDPTALASMMLIGNPGLPVTGHQGGWLEVMTPTGQKGYVQSSQVQLLMRLWNNISFQTETVSVNPGTISGPTSGTKAYEWNNTVYAPISFLGHAANATVTWDAKKRLVEVTTLNGSLLGIMSSSIASSIENYIHNSVASSIASSLHIPVSVTKKSPDANQSLGTAIDSTRSTDLTVRTSGIEVTLNGEPVHLDGEAVWMDGNICVPVTSFWKALGGQVISDAHGLHWTSPSGS